MKITSLLVASAVFAVNLVTVHCSTTTTYHDECYLPFFYILVINFERQFWVPFIKNYLHLSGTITKLEDPILLLVFQSSLNSINLFRLVFSSSFRLLFLLLLLLSPSSSSFFKFVFVSIFRCNFVSLIFLTVFPSTNFFLVSFDIYVPNHQTVWCIGFRSPWSSTNTA